MEVTTGSQQAKGRLINETTSLCRECKNAVAARVVALADNTVWMRKRCEEHGAQEVQLSDDAEWYERTRKIRPIDSWPNKNVRPMDEGCPFDCGPCESHRQKVRLSVVTITSKCNLDCPICYVHNKNDHAFHMSVEEFEKVLDSIVDEHSPDGKGSDVDLINLTGGDPTMHPNLFELIEMCQERGIHRVSICTNGIELAKDEAVTKRLAELGARVALSFDSFEDEPDYALQGARLVNLKHKCLDLLEKHDVDTTLIPVMTAGMNDHEIGDMIELLIARPNIRHLEAHTITYTGQSGVSFDRSGRISMHEVLLRIEETTDGFLAPSDFIPSPAAHPLCYQIAYLLLDPKGGRPVPFSRFLDAQTLYECLGDHLYLEPTPRLEQAFIEAIDQLWVEDDAESKRILQILRAMLDEMFPPSGLSREESLRVSERAIKAIYVHSHMDEETFDTERASQCCDSNCYADGSTIPVCNYNVLYREKESRFMERPLEWNERSGGQVEFTIWQEEDGWLSPTFQTDDVS
jgi:uncharacterized radical SAM superfamily Fe-S cluster-containing enzyme